jgi:hypothetical protein
VVFAVIVYTFWAFEGIFCLFVFEEESHCIVNLNSDPLGSVKFWDYMYMPPCPWLAPYVVFVS